MRSGRIHYHDRRSIKGTQVVQTSSPAKAGELSYLVERKLKMKNISATAVNVITKGSSTYVSSLPQRDVDSRLSELATARVQVTLLAGGQTAEPIHILNQVMRKLDLDLEYTMCGIVYKDVVTTYNYGSGLRAVSVEVTLVAKKNRIEDYLAWQNSGNYDRELPLSSCKLETPLTPELWWQELEKGTVPFWFSI